MAKEKDEIVIEDGAFAGKPLFKLLREGVSALRTIALEKKKQTKLLEQIAGDIQNISTDLEEIKTDL